MDLFKNFNIFKNLKLNKHKTTKIGLALGGGGTRGFVHLGAFKAFEEYGLKFDVIAGTSVGSLMGAFLAAGYNYSDMYKVAKEIDMKDIRTNIIPYKTSKTDGLEKIIKDNIGDINIEDLKTKYIAVCTDLISTNEVCFTKGNLAKAVAGSCCLPYVFYPVSHRDKLLIDGGLHNTIPSDIPKLFDCDYVIAVDVNKSRLYGTDSPKLINVLTCCFRILMKNNATKGYRYADIIVQPETKRFKSLKTEGLEDMIEEGYKETIDRMPEILKIFNSKPKSAKEKKEFLKEYKAKEKIVEIL